MIGRRCPFYVWLLLQPGGGELGIPCCEGRLFVGVCIPCYPSDARYYYTGTSICWYCTPDVCASLPVRFCIIACALHMQRSIICRTFGAAAGAEGQDGLLEKSMRPTGETLGCNVHTHPLLGARRVAWVSEANTGARLRTSCEQGLRCRELVQCLGLDSWLASWRHMAAVVRWAGRISINIHCT